MCTLWWAGFNTRLRAAGAAVRRRARVLQERTTQSQASLHMDPHAKASSAASSCPALLLEEPGPVNDVQQSFETLRLRKESLQQRIDKEMNPHRKAMLQKLLDGASSGTEGLDLQPAADSADGPQSQLSAPSAEQRREERQRQVSRLVAQHQSQAQEVAAASGSSSCSPTSSNAGDFDAAGEVPCMDLDEAAALIAAAGGEALHDDAQVVKV